MPFGRTKHTLAALLLTGVSACWASRAHGRPAEDLERNFREEAPARWEAYKSFADTLAGEGTAAEHLNDKPYSGGAFKLRHNDSCALALYRAVDEAKKKDTSTLYAYNPSYSFALARRADSPWVATSIVMLPVSAGKIDPNTSEVKRESEGARLLISISGMLLPDLLHQPNFKLLAVTPARRNEQELVEVRFDNTHPMKEAPFCDVQSGTLYLDRNHHWCLRSATLACKYANADATLTEEMDVVDDNAKWLVPKTWKHRSDQMRSDGAHLVLTKDVDYQLHEESPAPPDKEFTLSAFGLPEPFYAKRPSRPYLWLAVGGFGCFVISVILYRLRKARMAGEKAV